MTQSFPPPGILPSEEGKSADGRWPVYSASFLLVTGNTLIMVGLLFYLRDVLKASEGMVGLCTSAGMGAYAIGVVSLRKICEKTGARKLVLISLTCITLSTSLLTLVPFAWFVLLMQIGGGIALTFYWPPIMGWLTHGLEGKKLSRTISMFNLSWSAGGIIGPAAAGAISELNVYYPLIAGPVLVGTALIIMLIAGKFKSADHAAENENTSEEKTDNRTRETKLRYAAWTGLFVAFVSLGIAVVVFPIYAREVLGFAKKDVGMFLFQRSLVMTLTFLFLGAVVFWHYLGMQMILGQLLFALSIIGLSFSTGFSSILFCMAGVGIGTGLSYANSLFHGVAGARSRTGRAAVHETVLAFGFITGATGGGYLYEATSMAVVFAAIVTLLLLSGAVQGIMMVVIQEEDRRQTAEDRDKETG